MACDFLACGQSFGISWTEPENLEPIKFPYHISNTGSQLSSFFPMLVKELLIMLGKIRNQ